MARISTFCSDWRCDDFIIIFLWPRGRTTSELYARTSEISSVRPRYRPITRLRTNFYGQRAHSHDEDKQLSSSTSHIHRYDYIQCTVDRFFHRRFRSGNLFFEFRRIHRARVYCTTNFYNRRVRKI